MTPLLFTTSLSIELLALAESITRPPLACSAPLLITLALSAGLSTAMLIRPSPLKSRVTFSPAPSITEPSLATTVPSLRTWAPSRAT